MFALRSLRPFYFLTNIHFQPRRSVYIGPTFRWTPFILPRIMQEQPIYIAPPYARENLYQETKRITQQNTPSLFPAHKIFCREEARRMLSDETISQDQRLINCLQFLIQTKSLNTDRLYKEIQKSL